jgi:hypothetical protein
VEIRIGRQLTRMPDVLVIRSEQPGRHWFAPSEVLMTVAIESQGSLYLSAVLIGEEC